MDDSERFAAGMKKRRKVLGDAWVERPRGQVSRAEHCHIGIVQ